MENTPYMDSMVAKRAQLLTEEEQLLGETLISLETGEEFQRDDVFAFFLEHFPDWLNLIRVLRPSEQTVLLSYYSLGKTQTSLSLIYNSTQTVMSFRIRMLVKTVAAFLLWGGPPPLATVQRILAEKNLDIFPGNYRQTGPGTVPLSQLIAEASAGRTLHQLADQYNLHRPDIRRGMSCASKALLGHAPEEEKPEDEPEVKAPPEQQALGVFLHWMLDSSSATVGAKGNLSRRRLRGGHLYIVDPPCLGSFRINILDPGFPAMFISKANR